MLTKDDLQQIATLMNALIKPLQEGQERLEKKLKKQGKDMNYIKKTLDVGINMFDQETISLKKRVKRIEHHIGISTVD